MSSAAAPEHRGRDLDDRVEIAEFVTRFYREIAQDERFHQKRSLLIPLVVYILPKITKHIVIASTT